MIASIASKSRPAEILVVEDNYGDVVLLKKAFSLSDCPVPCNLTVASDGEQARKILKQEAPYENAALPDVILLDLNVPKISGHQLLEMVKNDTRLLHIPVVVLTSSNASNDMLLATQNHANAYVVKPDNLETLTAIIRHFQNFWLMVAVIHDGKVSL